LQKIGLADMTDLVVGHVVIASMPLIGLRSAAAGTAAGGAPPPSPPTAGAPPPHYGRSRMTKTVVIVVATFVVCQTPYHAMQVRRK